MKIKLCFLLLISLVSVLKSQEITQVVKGSIVDQDTRMPLFGANVMINGSDPVLGAVTGSDGTFRLEGVPVGRHDIRASFIGYEPVILREVLVGSGREVILNIGLKESSVRLNEVVISAHTNKDEPLNEMAMVSARQLSVEEASRYAGGFDDPSRLAGSFAGVAQNIGNNGIVIRGNSPAGLLWQMEGIQISNPTHFANYVAFGAGGITALSSQVLANSDFFTGAFPAEYGNGLSGVFDLEMKTGNRDKREFTLQAGLTGLDFSSEGPFRKSKGSSYLFNYRYSTFALLRPILPEQAGLIEYQDLSWKTNFPLKNAGTLSFWGLSALDYQGRDAKTDISNWESDDDREKLRANLFMGVAGLTHNLIISKKSFLKTTLAMSGNGMKWSQERLDSNLTYMPKEDVDVLTYQYTLAASVNHKFNAAHINISGIKVNRLHYDVDIDHADSYKEPYVKVACDQGHSYLWQAHSQSRIRFGEKWAVTGGVYAQLFSFNGQYSIEPRAAVSWSVYPGQSLALAYGLHSQLEQITFYLTNIQSGGTTIRPNEDLGFSKAHHLVLSYDLSINENTRLKIEPFYQYLYNIPVIPGSSYSIQNIRRDWIITDTLVNRGEGVNMGIDLTLERFLANGYYYLVAASIFDSRYKGGDAVWRDTRYNRNYVINILGGKEWLTGRKKQNLLSLNAKLTLMGGEHYDPILYDRSLQEGQIIYDDARAFSKQEPHSNVLSLNFSYRINKLHHSSVWTLSILNATGESEFDGYYYDETRGGTIEKREDSLVIPNISYKIEF